ncbi:MAG: TetR family transcriptional regulator [Microbacteriaceae bacterium]|jgi:AcrR family transcriptional regulator|nr:TetR family transcriptional regulator [Microbacteriaceae bacterium]
MTSSPRANGGRGAGATNRAALIAAARSIFATHGLDAPLSSVARQAGVGQGSLYRHFPTRSSLAVAVFQENLDAVEELAAHGDSTLGDVLRALTGQAIQSTAFFEMLQIEHVDADSRDLARRIGAVLSPMVEAAHADGTIARWLTTDDVLLCMAMLAGALAKSPRAQRDAVAARIWMLLPFDPSPPR